MWRNFALSGVLLLCLNATGQAQQNAAPPILPPALQHLLNPSAVAEPDWTIPGYPQPVEFSYAKPALEAAQWWSGIQDGAKGGLGTDSLSNAQLAKSRQAVERFAQAHKDDAPLLVAWQVGSESWRVHLAPAEAASPRFPPSIQEWGVPKRRGIGPANRFRLVPYGSANGMSPQEASPLIIWSPANAMRWQMLFLSTRSSPTWFDSQMPVDVQSDLFSVASKEGNEAVVIVDFSNQEEANLVGNAMRSSGFIYNPIISLNAALKQQDQFERGDESASKKNFDQNVKAEIYWTQLFTAPYFSLYYASVAEPARFSRAQASLAVRYLTDRASSQTVPSWIEQGLQNLYSLNMADKVADTNHPYEWLPLLPKPVEDDWNRQPYSKFYRDWIETYSRTHSLAATPIDEATPWLNFYVKSRDISRDGPLLENEDCTSQMRFFFSEYGNGAVTETLQRLGSGQSFEVALHETIGLTPAQFLAAWQQAQN